MKPKGTKLGLRGRQPGTGRTQPRWAPTVTPWSLRCHHPGPEVVDVAAACGGRGGGSQDSSQSHLLCHLGVNPRPGPTRQAEAQKDQLAENVCRRMCELCLGPRPNSGPASQQKQNRNKIQKKQTNKQTHTHKNTPHTGTATGQRSPEAPALYGCTKPHQARTTPRHRQDGSRKGKGVSHFRYNCKRYQRGRPLVGSQLGFFFFFFFFLN